MKLVNGDGLSALTTPTSHCLHAGRLLTCVKLPIHIHSSSSKINKLVSNKGFNIHAQVYPERDSLIVKISNILLSRKNLIYESFEYILKIDSPKNLSPNLKKIQLHGLQYYTYFLSILDFTQTLKMHVIVNITTKQSRDIIMRTQ